MWLIGLPKNKIINCQVSEARETLTGGVQLEIVDYGMYVNEAWASVCMSFEAQPSVCMISSLAILEWEPFSS